jgi:hypothetical protein
MRCSISAIITAAGLAISAAAPATAFAESFERDLALNQVQVSANAYSGQDSFKQWNNVALSGKNKPLIANYDADQNAFQQQSKLAAAFDDQVLAMGLPMIRKMVGVESRLLSEHNDSDVRVCAIY